MYVGTFPLASARKAFTSAAALIIRQQEQCEAERIACTRIPTRFGGRLEIHFSSSQTRQASTGSRLKARVATWPTSVAARREPALPKDWLSTTDIALLPRGKLAARPRKTEKPL